MLASIKTVFLLSAALVQLGQTLPLVDSGLFVILGVSTCRDSTGYCLLGSDCTLDHDFSPDDTGGHCNGLRTAFTPAANFVCCKYNGADVKLPSTTTEAPMTSTLPPLKITTQESKPSRRPVISGGTNKPQSPSVSSDDVPGAIFWVDLNSSGGANSHNTVKFEPGTVYNANTHPGSSITVSGMPSVDLKVPVSDTPNLENWIKPGVVMNIPGILATKPGSTVTISGGNELLEEIVQAVGSEVSHGVSITQGPIVSPSLQLDTVDDLADGAEEVSAPVGSIEGHEPKPQIEILKPLAQATTTTAKPSKPAVATTSTAKPTTAAAEEEAEEEEESEGEDEDEDASEEEEESEEEEDDGLFGLADLVELLGLDTTQKAGAAQVSAKNNTNAITEDDSDSIESKLGEHNLPNNALLQERVDNKTEEEHSKEPENLVGGFLAGFGPTDSTNATYETSTLPLGGLFTSTVAATPEPEEEEEEPPLCFGPVREPTHPACWAVSFKSNDLRGTNKNLCWGARITRDLVVTSASCAVRISAMGIDAIQAFLPATSDNQTEFSISEVIVHEEYHAAPHLALSDIGLVKLNTTCSDITEMDMGGCTLCLSQDNKADYSHLSCHTPQIFEEEGVTKAQLSETSMAQRSSCENLTKTEDLANLQAVFLCSVPPKTNEDMINAFEGNPLVCSGRRGIPFLAGVRMKSALQDWTIYTPVSGYVEWIRANELPQIIKTVTTNPSNF